MATLSLEALQQDNLAMSVARAVALANEAAALHGIQPAENLVTISEESGAQGSVWRVHYGPRDFAHRRGGDLIVVVDEPAAQIKQVIRGQ